MDYECQVGLWLNIGRVELRRSSGVIQAIQAAILDDIGPEFFEAVANDENEGKALFEKYRANKATNDQCFS